jgi:S-adenosylmethionine:diacylglycerol 3-amino-3-carboxypropyl transferase
MWLLFDGEGGYGERGGEEGGGGGGRVVLNLLERGGARIILVDILAHRVVAAHGVEADAQLSLHFQGCSW